MQTTDLGHDHSYRLTRGRRDHYPTDDPRLQHDDETTIIGAIVEHLNEDGRPCAGHIHFDRGMGDDQGQTWEVRSLDPLHLEPSLLCTVCGDHGWIRGGRWQPTARAKPRGGRRR